jgi:hypothetical protein
MIIKEQVEESMNKWNHFKESAEQHSFIGIMMWDKKLEAAYSDLNTNWDEHHADLFIKMIDKLMRTL